MSDSLLEQLTHAAQLRLEYASTLDVQLADVPTVLTEVDRANKAILSGDWNAVRTAAARCTSLTGNLRSRLIEAADQRAVIALAVRDLSGPLQAAFDALAESPDRDARIAQIVALLERAGANSMENLADLLRDALDDDTIDIQETLASYDLQPYDAPLRRLASTVVLGRVRTLWVRHLADFNASLRILPVIRRNQPLFNDAIFADLKAAIEDREQLLRSRQRALYESPNASAWLENTRLLIDAATAALPALAETQATLNLCGFALRTLGKGGLSEQVGSAAAAAAALARELMSSVAAAERIALRLHLRYPDADVDELIAAAATTPFDGNPPHGKDIALHHLQSVEDGRYIELAAYVQQIETRRVGDKLISRAWLKDPSSGARAIVAAIFVHFRHIGLTGGCFLRASGTWRHASDLADGHAALEVDRLSLKTLAASSWRIGLLRLSQPWFEVWRNAQNLTYSWGAHRPAADASASAPGLDGAVEPVFTPFVRKTDNA